MISEFSKNGKGRLDCDCKICNKSTFSNYLEKTKERNKQRCKEYYLKRKLIIAQQKPPKGVFLLEVDVKC
jgi:hypothetical protein